MASIMVSGATSTFAAAGPWGWLAALALQSTAAYLDATLVSSFAKNDPIDGPRLGSLKLNTSDEGSPVQVPYGRRVRIPAQVLDVTQLRETRNTTTQNGKGGSGAEFVEFKYSCDVMLSFGQGPAEDIKQIRANGKAIWGASDNLSITAADITGTPSSISNQNPTTQFTFSSVAWNSSSLTLVFSTTTAWEAYDSILSYVVQIVEADEPFRYSLSNATVSVANGVRTYTLTVSAAPFGPFSSGPVTIVLSKSFAGSIDFPWSVFVLTLQAPLGGSDLSQFVPGDKPAQITAPASVAGSYTVSDSGTLSNGDTYVKLRRTTSAFAAISSGTTVTISQNISPFDTSVFSSIDIAKSPTTGKVGGHDISINPLFQSFRAPEEIPAYRGRIVVTITNLQLFDFGNTLPQFEADVIQSSTAMVSDAVESICADGGLDPAILDVENISSIPLLGFTSQGANSAIDRLAPLMLGYEIVTREEEGILVFDTKTTIPTVAVASSDLSAVQEGATSPRPASFSDAPQPYPSEVVVNYRSPDRDFTLSSAVATRYSQEDRIQQTIDLSGLQLEPTYAYGLAYRTAHLIPVSSRQIEFSVPISYASELREGVRATVTVNARQRTVLVLSVSMAANGVMEVIGVLDDPLIYTVNPDVPSQPIGLITTANSSGGQVGSAYPIDAFLFNSAPLRDEHANKTGFYAAATSTSERFKGAGLYSCSDLDLEEWKLVARLEGGGVLGVTTSTLGSCVEGVWDESSYVDVEVSGGTLESVTELSCLNGRNRAYVGSEMIGYRNAVLTGPSTYRISGLIRGMRGTEIHSQAHRAGERVVFLTAGNVSFVELEPSAIGSERIYKIVKPGQPLAEVEAFAFVCDGSTATNFRPTDIRGTRDAANNLTIEWKRVSRSNVRIISQQAVSMVEPFERYEVEIRSSSDSILRTIVVGAPACVYTAAQQTADGLTPGSPVYVLVRQIGDIVHSGKERGAVV